jgi:hypothetical protein
MGRTEEGRIAGEPRSWREGPDMGEMTPFDLSKMSAKEAQGVLGRAILQVHDCVEQLSSKVQAVNEVANGTREVMGNSIARIEGQVSALTVALGVQPPPAGEARPKAKHTLPGWIKTAVAIGSVGGSLAGIGALYRLFHAIWPAVEAYLLSGPK